MDHLKVIEVPLDKITGGFPESMKKWWNWKPYFDTWKIYDEHPDTPLKQYPLYKVWLRVFGYRNIEDLEDWCLLHVRRGLALYNDIKVNGYIPEKSREDPLTVNILKDGVIKLFNGHHRIGIMKYLEWPKMVRVVVRERKKPWLAFKQTAFRIYNRKQLYQSLEHPDFADWTVVHNCQDRLDAIVDHYGGVRGRRVLDIGSCTGWFSIKLAQMGAHVVGSEIDKTKLGISKVIAGYHNLRADNPEFIGTDYKAYLARTKRRFDFILFLNLLHHSLEKNVRESWSIVNMLSEHTDVMYLGIGELKLLIKPKLVPQAILDHSDFDSYKLLLRTTDNRPLYAFRKRVGKDVKLEQRRKRRDQYIY